MGWEVVQRILKAKQPRWVQGLPGLGAIWLTSSLGDRLWLALDRSTPAWDAADYLTGCLNYWQALQTAQWFSGQWWTNLWLLSSKIPPLVYISTAPFISLFGGGPDQIILSFLVYSAILLASVYALGAYLFRVRVGLWAAALCVLMPTLYKARLEFLLDYPLTAMVALSFLCLTVWREICRQDQTRPANPLPQTSAPALAIAPVALVPEPDPADPPTASDRPVAQPLLSMAEVSVAETGDSPPAAIAPAMVADAPPLPRRAPWQTQFLRQWHTTQQTWRADLRSPQAAWMRLRSWVWAILFGLSLGFALMTKQPALFFLLLPMLWFLGESLWARQWWRVAQCGVAVLASLVVWVPWYRANWLLILTSGKRATVDSAAIQGDPSILSPAAWIAYPSRLPGMVSWPLLVVPVLGLLLFWRRSRVSSQWSDRTDYEPKPREYRDRVYAASRHALGWLLIFMLGAYVLSTLNPNKAERYVAPYLPELGVILAYGLTLLPRSWRWLQWSNVALAGVLMVAFLFPWFGPSRDRPQAHPLWHHPYQGPPYPHAQIIEEVVRTEPYLRSTIGVLPSTPEVNQHNINYYGLLADFQVYGRQVGTREAYLQQDQRSLPWFLTKTGEQGSFRRPELQAQMVQAVEQPGAFKLQKAWDSPDGGQLRLYRRANPAIAVAPLDQPPASAQTPIRLTQVTVPPQVPPGQPFPVTYAWQGSWEALRSGLVLLTWRRQTQTTEPKPQRWFHDHGIALGELHPEIPPQATATTPFQVTEQLATLPPAGLVPGTYRLDAMYFDRRTGKTTAIAVPAVTLQISPTAAPVPAPEPDLVTQLAVMASTLPQGTAALTNISNEISRINQYDPIQDYLKQAQQAMTYRLEREPNNRQFAYTLALATVLDRQVNAAIAALQRVTELDPKNPYAYAYLAFVDLYDFRAGAAQAALAPALKLNPELPELHGLNAIAAVMRGNLIQAWQEFQIFQRHQDKLPQ